MTAINRGFRSFANFLACGVSIVLYLVCFTRFFSATLPRYHRMRYFLLSTGYFLRCLQRQHLARYAPFATVLVYAVDFPADEFCDLVIFAVRQAHRLTDR